MATKNHINETQEDIVKKLLPYIDGLHILPWFTDGAVDFLDSYIFHFKQNKGKNPTVFEFGGGGSTLYFLSRGCFVYTVDHDAGWINSINSVASVLGQSDRLWLAKRERPYNKTIFEDELIDLKFDLMCVDGRDRVLCLESSLTCMSTKKSLKILDNTERVSDKYSAYIELLNDHYLMHLETPFVFGAIPTEPESATGLNLKHTMPTNGLAAHVYRDRSGNCNKGRSITTIAVPCSMGMFTTQGIPLINRNT